MKNVLLPLIVIFSSLSAFASQKIQQIYEGGALLDEHVSLFLSDGEIVHFLQSNNDLLVKANSALKNSFNVEFKRTKSTLDDTADTVTGITLLPELVIRANTSTSNRPGQTPNIFSDLQLKLLDIDSRDPAYGSNLTRFSSYDQAQTVMNNFNGATDDDSQCYNRAHMWTYEALVDQRVNLGKVWIFFTKRYIREYRYKWWFHVSPFASVADGNEKYVLDRGFTQVPYNMTNWKNLFIKSRANCPVITDYRSYENYQEQQHCYLIYSNQYFWQPYQLKNAATHGSIQTRYNMSDLRITYKDALTRWDGRIPRMPTTTIPDRPRPERPVPDRPTPDTGSDSRWLRIGQQVISSNGVEGRVTAFLGNGYVDVQFTTARSPMSQHADTLAVRHGSSGGFTVGNRVLSTNNVPGVVSGIYRDGRIAVKYQGTAQHLWQYADMLRHRE